MPTCASASTSWPVPICPSPVARTTTTSMRTSSSGSTASVRTLPMACMSAPMAAPPTATPRSPRWVPGKAWSTTRDWKPSRWKPTALVWVSTANSGVAVTTSSWATSIPPLKTSLAAPVSSGSVRRSRHLPGKPRTSIRISRSRVPSAAMPYRSSTRDALPATRWPTSTARPVRTSRVSTSMCPWTSTSGSWTSPSPTWSPKSPTRSSG